MSDHRDEVSAYVALGKLVSFYRLKLGADDSLVQSLAWAFQEAGDRMHVDTISALGEARMRARWIEEPTDFAASLYAFLTPYFLPVQSPEEFRESKIQEVAAGLLSSLHQNGPRKRSIQRVVERAEIINKDTDEILEEFKGDDHE